MSKQPIVIEESVWMNSHLSIARHYGQVKINGNMYMLCNKSGITIFVFVNRFISIIYNLNGRKVMTWILKDT